MGTWIRPFASASTFLGAGGSVLGGLGGGPVNPGVAKTQPLANRNGQLRANYECPNTCGCA